VLSHSEARRAFMNCLHRRSLREDAVPQAQVSRGSAKRPCLHPERGVG
jgi:hypothetical protein